MRVISSVYFFSSIREIIHIFVGMRAGEECELYTVKTHMFVETISFCDFKFMVDQCLRRKLEHGPTIIIIQYDERDKKNRSDIS